MPCFPDRPLCLVNFKHFSSFLQRCSGLGRTAKPPDLRSFASGNTQYKLTQASTFPGQGVSPLTRWGWLPSTRQWALPLDPSSALPPLHPGTKGWLPSVLPHRRSWLSPQKRFLPVSPAPYPYISAHRREVDTEYACGNCRSKHWVQTRYFFVNRPHFKRFFLLSV